MTTIIRSIVSETTFFSPGKHFPSFSSSMPDSTCSVSMTYATSPFSSLRSISVPIFVTRNASSVHFFPRKALRVSNCRSLWLVSPARNFMRLAGALVLWPALVLARLSPIWTLKSSMLLAKTFTASFSSCCVFLHSSAIFCSSLVSSRSYCSASENTFADSSKFFSLLFHSLHFLVRTSSSRLPARSLIKNYQGSLDVPYWGGEDLPNSASWNSLPITSSGVSGGKGPTLYHGFTIRLSQFRNVRGGIIALFLRLCVPCNNWNTRPGKTKEDVENPKKWWKGQ